MREVLNSSRIKQESVTFGCGRSVHSSWEWDGVVAELRPPWSGRGDPCCAFEMRRVVVAALGHDDIPF